MQHKHYRLVAGRPDMGKYGFEAFARIVERPEGIADGGAPVGAGVDVAPAFEFLA
jgi:hypothetical protein